MNIRHQLKLKKALLCLLLLAGCSLVTASSAQAQTTVYWDTNSNVAGFGVADGTWNSGNTALWSTSSAGTATTPNRTITNLDDINFGTLANAYSGTVTLSGNTTARSATFSGSSVVTLKGNGTARTLTLGSGGLTMNGTSAVTMGDGVAGNNLLIGLGSTGQTWTNNTANNLTILNTAATFTRSAGGTLTFNQAGAGVFSMSTTVLNNDATGIVGPWAFFGSGTSTRYAFNNAGTIAGYSGGTAAAGAEDFTSATTNYDFDGSGTNTLTTNRTANTVRYTGTGNVIDLGAAGTNTLTANGILAVGGSGTLTIQRTGGTGTLVAGSTGANSELVIAGPQNISISAPISNGIGNSALTYRGTGTLTLSGANTYTGANTVSSGTLVVGSATALGTTGKALNVNGSGTLDLNDFDYTFGAFNGDNGTVTNSSANFKLLTVGTGNASSNFNGAITGKLSLTKVGTGALNLGTSNTYTGGTNLNGTTTFTFRPGMFGTGIINVNANTTMNVDYGAYSQYANALHVAGGATLTTTGSTQYYGQTFTGVVSGSGIIKTGGSGNDANTREKLGLYNAANTFTGTLVNEGGSAIINVNSLGDGGKIQLKAGTGGLQLGAGTATSLLFNTRQVELFGSSVLQNNNASAAITFTVNTDLTYNGAGVRTLTLGGGNIGNNAFNGLIANNGASAVSLTKADAGTWILGDPANSYTGATTIQAGTLSINSISNVSGGASAIGNPSSVANGRILMGTGNSTGTLRYTGGTQTTDRTIQINSSVNTNNGGATIINDGTGALTFDATTFNNAYVNANSVTRTLTLGGTNGGDIQGIIQNNSATNLVAIAKTGIGTWTLSGDNDYTGTTTVNGGTLIAGTNSLVSTNGAFGNSSSEIAFGVAGGATNAAILTGGAYTIGRDIRLLSNNTTDTGSRVLTIGGNTAHNSEFSGNIFLGTTNQAGRGLTLTAANGGQVTFSGVIQNPGGMDATTYTVTKSGLGTVILSNTNTYTGATLVDAGRLLVSGSLTSNVEVSDNATLGGGGTVGDLLFGGGSFFDIFEAIDNVNSLTANDISFNAGFGIDNLMYNGAAINDWSSILSNTYTLISGNLNPTNLDNVGLVNAFDIGGGRSAYFQEGSLQLVVTAAIPEPSAALIGGLGVLALLRRRRR